MFMSFFSLLSSEGPAAGSRCTLRLTHALCWMRDGHSLRQRKSGKDLNRGKPSAEGKTVSGQDGVDLSVSRALPASIWRHCSQVLVFTSISQKNPCSVSKIRVRNSGAGNGCANFMDAWKNAFFLQENPFFP